MIGEAHPGVTENCPYVDIVRFSPGSTNWRTRTPPTFCSRGLETCDGTITRYNTALDWQQFVVKTKSSSVSSVSIKALEGFDIWIMFAIVNKDHSNVCE